MLPGVRRAGYAGASGERTTIELGRPGPRAPGSLAVIFGEGGGGPGLGMSGATPNEPNDTSASPDLREVVRFCVRCERKWPDFGKAADRPDCPFCGARLGAEEVGT